MSPLAKLCQHEIHKPLIFLNWKRKEKFHGTA